MFALIDCNNFYVSCERLFRPDLWKRPIIVLSNNDGYVVDRSSEVKAIGIEMGEPYINVKAFCNRAQVQVFLPNYPLYADLSHRVMSVITELWPTVEIYSINEAFLELTTLPQSEHEAFCTHLQNLILHQTGIPTSIGIGSTKTLAKLANEIAKTKLNISIFRMVNTEYWLGQMDVNDIWGVGRRLNQRLHQLGIHTALELTQENPQWIKQQFSEVLQRTVYELLGESCLELEEITPDQSILCSQSFSEMQIEYEPVSKALRVYCANALEALRQKQLLTKQVSIFLHTNTLRLDLKQYHPHIGLTFVRPTDNMSRITEAALFGLKKIFKPGIFYHKVGVMFTDLTGKSKYRYPFVQAENQKQIDRMALKEINCLPACGTYPRNSIASINRSPGYTTAWADLPLVKAH